MTPHILPTDYSLSQNVKVTLVASRIAAGFPSPADDFSEQEIDLNDYLLKNKSATFLARVEGDSMMNCGIHDGDIVVIDKSIKPKNYDVVIGALNGEFTIKRFVKEKGKVFLVPENENYTPIEISSYDDFTVWGVVKFAIKHL